MIGVVPVTDVGVVVSCINASITVVNSTTTGYGLLTVVSPLVFSSTSPTPLTSFGIELQNTMVVMSRLTAVINSHIVLMQGPNVLLPGLCSITNFSVSLDLMNISSPLPGPNCLTLVQIRNVSSVLFTLSRSVALGTFVAMVDQSNATDVMMRLNTSKVVSGGLVNQTVRTLFSNLTQFSLSGVGCEIVVVGQNTFLFGAFVTVLRSASVRFVDNNVSTLGNIWISQSTTSDMDVALVNSSNGARTFIFYSFMSNLVRFLLIVTGSRSVSLGFCAMYLTVTALTDSQFLFVDCGITVATSFFYMADRSPISGNVQFLISRSQLTFPNVNFMLWKSSAASLPSSLLSVTVEDSTLAVYTFLVLDMVGGSSAVIVSNSSVEVNPNGNIVAYSSASSGSSAHVSRSTISGGVYLVTSTFALSDLLVLLVDSNILNVQLLAYIYHALLSNITLRLVNTSVAAAFTWGIVLISSGVAGTGQIALEAGSVIRAAGIGIIVRNFAPIVQSGNGSSFLNDGVLLYISNSTIVGPTNCISMTQTNMDSFGILLAGATLQSYAVVFDAQLSSTTQLNLTVVDGTIAYGSFTISCPYLAATFTNSTILLSNQSTSASFIFANCSSSNITLSRCNFTQTSLGGAGSVVIVNNTASTLTLTVQECVLQGPSVIVRSTKSSASATLALHVPGGLINATRQPDGGCCLLSEDPVASISITVESATIVATGGSLPNMFVVSLVPVPVLSLTMISSEIVSSSGSSSLVTPMNVSSSFSLLMFNVTAHCEVKGRCPCVVNCTSCAERISLVLDRTNFSGFTRFVALPPQAAVGPVAQMNGSIELYCSRWDARWLSRKLQFHALDTYYATAEFPKSLADPFYRCPKLDSASGSVSTLTSSLTRFTASPTIPARSLSSSQSQTGTGSTSISSTLTVTGSSSETIASSKSSSSTFSTTSTLVVTATHFGTASSYSSSLTRTETLSLLPTPSISFQLTESNSSSRSHSAVVSATEFTDSRSSRSTSTSISCPLAISYVSSVSLSVASLVVGNRSSLPLGSLLAAQVVFVQFAMVPGVIPVAAGANATTSLGGIANVSVFTITSSSDKNNKNINSDTKEQSTVVVAVSLASLDLLTVTLVSTNELVVVLSVPLLGSCIPEGFASHEVLSVTLLPLRYVTALQLVVKSSNRAAVSASSLTGNPLGALTTTAMVSLLAMELCEFSDVDPLDPSVSPLGFAVGASVGQYNRGAAVAALGIYGVWMAVVFAGAAALQRPTLFDALAQLRFPSAMMLVIGVFHQGLATVSISLMRGAGVTGIGDAVLGIFGLAASVGICCYAALATTSGLRRSCVMMPVKELRALSYERHVPGLQTLLAWSNWRHHWADRASDVISSRFKQRHFMLVDQLKAPWWTAFELTSSSLQGAALGIRLNDDGVCRAVAAVMVVLSALMLAAAVYWKPCGPVLDNVFLVLSKLAAVVIAVLVLICAMSGSVGDGSDCSGADIVAVIATYVSAIQTILLVLNTAVDLLRKAAGKEFPGHWAANMIRRLFGRQLMSQVVPFDVSSGAEAQDELSGMFLCHDEVVLPPASDTADEVPTSKEHVEISVDNERPRTYSRELQIHVNPSAAIFHEQLSLLRQVALRSLQGQGVELGVLGQRERDIRLKKLLQAAALGFRGETKRNEAT